jgi:sulfopyruvate decarboxylase alpha subunit
MHSDSQQDIAHWPDALFQVFRDQRISQVAYVPDAGHAHLIELCRGEPTMRAVVLTTEEEGVALLAGAWLGGQRGALLMQSSGVGNCINMLSLIEECRFPLLTLVTMRGQWGEFNPWQVPMGHSTAAALENAGVMVYPADDAARVVETVQAVAQIAFNTSRAAAVLIGQRVIGYKNWSR